MARGHMPKDVHMVALPLHLLQVASPHGQDMDEAE